MSTPVRLIVHSFVWLAIALGIEALAYADAASLLRGLDSDDPPTLSAGIAAIEHAPASPDLADVLFAAGRASEDRLHDPARALAIYERILREMPNASAAIPAGRRAQQLRGLGEHAREAADLAELIANADRYSEADIVRRADALAAAAWPGAIEAALWLADWSCRTRRFADAYERYQAVIARAPDSMQAQLARRNIAGCAVEAGDWERAEVLASALPHGDVVDDASRVDLLKAAQRGRVRQQLYSAAWIVLLCASLALLASLAEATLRGGLRAPAFRPPIEVLYVAPIAIVLIVASFVIDSVIGPPVTAISAAGIAIAWLSGMTLDLLRAKQRDVRLRAIAHVLGCALAIPSIGYIAIYRSGLIDMFTETVRFGPGA